METNLQVNTEVNIGLPQKIEGILRGRPFILQLLKFGAIGIINAALDFLILNVVSKTFNVTVGTNLGLINILSFSVAVIQSYQWNKAWAFGDAETNPVKNFWRLCAIGGLGSISVLLILVGAKLSVSVMYYVSILAAFIVMEFVLWKYFKLAKPAADGIKNQFAVFITISIGGLIINSIVVAVASSQLSNFVTFFGNEDVVKNVAKIIATGVSLVWNFIGYKVIVFKK